MGASVAVGYGTSQEAEPAGKGKDGLQRQHSTSVDGAENLGNESCQVGCFRKIKGALQNHLERSM